MVRIMACGMLLSLVLAARGEMRAWTVEPGRTLVATYVGRSLGVVTVETSDGREISLSTSRLSDADLAYIRERELAGPPTERPVMPVGTAPRFHPGDPEFAAAMAPGTMLRRASPGDAGVTWYLYVPLSYTADAQAPLLILFSPAGRSAPLVAALKDAADQAGWLIAGCDGLRSGMEDPNVERAMEDGALDDLLGRVPHRADRIYLGGASGGATRAFGLARETRRPERVAGILSLGGWLGGAERRQWNYQRRMAVAIVNGDGNKGANSWLGGDTIAIKQSGCRVRAFSFPGAIELPPPATTAVALAWLADPTRR